MGVLINRRSGRNRSGIEAERRLLAANSDVLWRETDHARAAGDALGELAAAGVNLLAINGGDGSLQRVFHLIYNRRIFERPPAIAILPGGTTNMIAHDVGAMRPPVKELELLIGRLRRNDWSGGVTKRWLIAGRIGDQEAPQYGLFAGAAGVYQGTKIARRSVDRIGMRDSAGPLAGLTGLLGPIFLGRNPIKPVQARITLDGQVWDERAFLCLVASSMDKLALNLTPWWNVGSGRIKFTAVAEGAKSIWRAVWPALRGRPSPLLTEANGYFSGSFDSIEIAMKGGVVMDGETARVRPDSPVRLHVGPEAVFVKGGEGI